MLCRQELEETIRLAEESGFRVNVVSQGYAIFLYEFIPNYDIIVTYSTIEGESKFEVSIESKEDMSPDELMSLCNASGLTLGLLKHMGGINF